MPYCLGAGRSVSKEVVRLLTEETGSAMRHLGGKTGKPRAKAVHEARKSVKKLRALLRLVEPQLSSDVFAATNKSLRNIGRTLSQLRDAQAMREAFESIAEAGAVEVGALDVARERVTAAANRVECHVEAEHAQRNAVAALRKVRATWKGLQLAEEGFAFLIPGLKQTFKRGRRAMVRAERKQDAESFHEWRKRVKDHWYHARLLSEVKASGWDQRLEELKTLEGLLGDDHNQMLLRDAVSDREKAVRPFTRYLRERSRELQDRALELGERLYGMRWNHVAELLSSADEIWLAGQPASNAKTKKAPVKVGADKARSAVA